MSGKAYPTDRIRNIGIIAHIDAGKTTTTERILYFTGVSHKIGEVHEGAATMDWMEQERERGITITSAATTCFWRDSEIEGPEYRINIIDTPGHVDFTAEVERSLRVLDGAVVIFDAKMGVEPQSETVWRQATKYNVPRICFANKINALGASYEKTFKSIQERLSKNAFILWLPIGEHNDHKGIIDLVSMKAWVYANDARSELKETEIPADMKDLAEKYRAEMLEKIVEVDDELMEKYLEDGELSHEEIISLIRKGTIENKIFPVMFGDGRTATVTKLLDSIVRYLPSPADIGTIEGVNPNTGEKETRELTDEEYMSALAFKVQTDPYVGQLIYIRIYSGQLESGSYVLNSTANKKERIGRLVRMHADKREEVKVAYAGEIVAAVGLKETKTGHTLCDPDHPIVLEEISFPEPVVSLKIEPKTKSDQAKLGVAIAKLLDEDPTFRMSTNEETMESIISGMGELHLEIIVDRLKREYGVEVNVGQPQVAYRETITKEAEGEGKYIKQTGGRGQYGHVKLRVKPLSESTYDPENLPKNVTREGGLEFINNIKGGVIPSEYIPAVKKGILEAMQRGIRAGYPVTDVSVEVYDGSYHEVDSSEAAFKIAASMAFQEAAKNAGPIILEPIMKVDVTVPTENMGDIAGDLSSKRGVILGTTEKEGGITVISAHVPLANMFGYTNRLRSMTSGRGSATMEFEKYEAVPPNVADEIVSKRNLDK